MNPMQAIFQRAMQNVAEAPEMDEVPLISKGWTHAEIERAEFRQNNSRTGHYVSIAFTLPAKNGGKRWLWINYNIDHANKQAESIGIQQFTKFLLRAFFICS